MYMHTAPFLNHLHLNKSTDIIFLKTCEIEHKPKLKYLMKQLVYDWTINLPQDLDQTSPGEKFNTLTCSACQSTTGLCTNFMTLCN